MAVQDADPRDIERCIGYCFNDPKLLRRALTHPSHPRARATSEHNQRLEFLGDAVLGMVLAEELFLHFPDEREGVLTRNRSILARGSQLSALAREIHLGEHLLLGEPEEAAGGRDLDSMLEDAFEALVGAVYLDGGLDAARGVMRQVYKDLRTRIDAQLAGLNPKGRLQELLQPAVSSEAIEYRLVEQSGPSHLMSFTIEVWIDGVCKGRGSGTSRQLAEVAAARKALECLADEP